MEVRDKGSETHGTIRPFSQDIVWIPDMLKSIERGNCTGKGVDPSVRVIGLELEPEARQPVAKALLQLRCRDCGGEIALEKELDGMVKEVPTDRK